MQPFEIIPWNVNFQTGLPAIDAQHRKLVRLINQLARDWSMQAEISVLNKLFEELADYAVYHFQTEEAVWIEYLPSDPWELKHKEEHANFVKAVLELKAEEKNKPLDAILEDVFKFLTSWLIYHILDSDMRMAKVVQAIQSGLPLPQAKEHADRAMSGAMKALIDSVLAMYESISNRSLHLVREIIGRQKAEAKLRLAANVFEHTLDAICITDAAENIIEVNRAFLNSTEYTLDDIIGKPLKYVKSGFDNGQLCAEIWDGVRAHENWSGEISNLTKNAELVSEWLSLSAIKNEKGLISNYVAVFSDISRLTRKLQNIERIARHDPLTGLPNRLELYSRLIAAMANAIRNDNFLLICFLDLDGFKAVNDRFGHATGDQVLKEVSIRLLNLVRMDDVVARLGGDEFVLLLGNHKNGNDIKILLERMLTAIAQPIVILNSSTEVTASIGVTVYPLDKSGAEELIEHADQAMYQAKQTGKSGYFLYGPDKTGLMNGTKCDYASNPAAGSKNHGLHTGGFRLGGNGGHDR